MSKNEILLLPNDRLQSSPFDEEIGGECLAGSGFEDEKPEPDFDERM